MARFCLLPYKKLLFIILFVIIIINLYRVPDTIEALTNMNIVDDVLIGVAADYTLYTYGGTTWTKLTKPKGLTTSITTTNDLTENPVRLLAITMGPDGNMYGIGAPAGTSRNLFVAEKNKWVCPKSHDPPAYGSCSTQSTTIEAISIATISGKLVLVGNDYKLYYFNLSTQTKTPVPGGDTEHVLSVVKYSESKDPSNNDEFAVGKDHKLYKWLNNKWVVYDDKASLISITAFNNQLVGVGTDKKLYMYGGAPGKWVPGAGILQLHSVYGMKHSDYIKMGFGVDITTPGATSKGSSAPPPAPPAPPPPTKK